GKFEQCNGGTLFLDEIGEMPVDMQPKLLRVLQEKKVRPVGGNHEQSVDLRILAATNRDLEAEVEAGRFREDLFYRINVVSLYLPALRHRGKDILLLAQHFLRRHGPGPGGKAFEIPAAFAKKLVAYDWPGNVRELENCIERATTLAMDHRLSVADLPARIRDFKSSQLLPSHTDPEELPTLEDMENRYILQVLKVVGGNKTQAAKVLGVERRTLYRRLEKLEAREDSTQEARR
ncbi:MAG: sigma 54-interacting transcriptional regulator, partial [Polyangiales bacterium]